jgi:hypothetical protein
VELGDDGAGGDAVALGDQHPVDAGFALHPGRRQAQDAGGGLDPAERADADRRGRDGGGDRGGRRLARAERDETGAGREAECGDGEQETAAAGHVRGSTRV